PVPWPEAPLALRQGLVQAIELPADLVRPVKFYESAKYLVLSRHRYQALYNTIADTAWQGLTEDEQRILLEAHAEAGKTFTDAQEANWAADKAFLKSEGVVIIDFDVSDWHGKVIAIARKLE